MSNESDEDCWLHKVLPTGGPTINDILLLDDVLFQLLQVFLIRCKAPRVGLQIFSIRLELSHQLPINLRSYKQHRNEFNKRVQ